MTSLCAVSPAMDPPSFPDPVFYPARRIHGLVETPELGGGDDDDDDDDSPPPIAQGFTEGGRPPLLQRHNSVTGNVLLLQHAEEGTKAFLLQRKVGTSAYGGSMRVGFCLQGDKPSDEDGLWHVVHKDGSSIDTSTAASNESSSPLLGSRKRDHAMMQEDIRDLCELVTVYIESETTLSGVVDGEGAHDTDTLKTELAALQWIANQSKTLDLNHLWGCTYMGNESGQIFAILSPFNRDGTLLDYCASYPNGTPPIEEAKFFFNQVLQVGALCQGMISFFKIFAMVVAFLDYLAAYLVPLPLPLKTTAGIATITIGRDLSPKYFARHNFTSGETLSLGALWQCFKNTNRWGRYYCVKYSPFDFTATRWRSVSGSCGTRVMGTTSV